MNGYTRSYPHGDSRFMALEQDKYQRFGFDTTEKIVLYVSADVDDPTVIDYYDTMSDANAAAATWAAANGRRPKIQVNWWHSDFARYPVGPVQHPDAREDYPDWLDEAQEY